MNRDKILETIELHRKRDDGRKKLFIAAALAAVLAAIAGALYGAFRLGKKRGVREEAERVAEEQRAESERRAAEEQRAQTAVRQPVYVVHPLPSQKPESGKKRFRRHLCAALSTILVISMVGSSTLPYVEPPTVLAKESFSGIGKIVEEHGDEPYKILDIVPADAEYYDTPESTEVRGTYTFRLGTMGYLVNGQNTLQADLAAAFQKGLEAKEPFFLEFSDREKLFQTIAGTSAPFGLTYEEAYGGVSGMSTDGYTLIYDPTAKKEAEKISAPASPHSFMPLVESENGDGAGDTSEPQDSNDGGDTSEPQGSNGSENMDEPQGGNGDTNMDEPQGGNGGADTGEPEESGDGADNTGETENTGGNMYNTNSLPGVSLIETSGDSPAVVGRTFKARVEDAKGNGNYDPVEPIAHGLRTMSLAGDNSASGSPIYAYGESGAPLRVTFKPIGPAAAGSAGGYVLKDVLGTMGDGGQPGPYTTDMTGVYYYHDDDGNYTYVDTVGGLLGRTYTRVENSGESGGNKENKEEQENKENKKEEQSGQTTPPEQVIPPEQVLPPGEQQPLPGGDIGESQGQGDGTGESEGQGGDPGESEEQGGNTGEPSESGGDPGNTEGSGEPSGGQSQPEESTGGSSNEDENNTGNNTEVISDPADGGEGDGEILSSRALLMRNGWYLLVEENAGDPGDSGEGDPVGDGEGDPSGDGEGEPSGDGEGEPVGDSEGDSIGDGTGDPVGDGAGDPSGDGEGGPADSGNDEQSDSGNDDSDDQDDGGQSFYYVMTGLSDEEVSWADYESLFICTFAYDPQPDEGEMLYEVLDVQSVIKAPGYPLSYDTYYASESAEGSEGENTGLNAMNAQLGTPLFTLNNGVPSPIGSGGLAPYATSAGKVYRYNPEGKGEVNLIYDTKNGEEITVQGAPVYIRCRTNDWLKQYVFSSLSGGDNESSDFSIDVTTLRADEVTAADVKEADLVFLESATGNAVLNVRDMKLNYIGGKKETAYPDMKEAAVSEILREAAEDLKPVIVDYGIAEDSTYYKDSNYQHLARALLKRDLAEFVEEMDAKDDFVANVGMNLGDSKAFPEKDDNDYNYVNQNIYVVNGALVSEGFPEKFEEDETRAGFSDVLSAIKAENTTLSEDDRISEWVSPARAVQYIINFSVGIIGDFSNLKILELQPSANLKSDFTLEDENTKLLWKKDSMRTAKQILFSKDSIEAQIDTKAVVEFNSEWEDINGIYDMVFIGLDGQRLNRNEDGETRYNNEDLNGKVYHTGDDSSVGTYDANDLSTQKMDALLHYMAAGYPVLVENDCFEEGSAQKADGDDINTDYIQEDSVMYRFLQTAVSDERYEDCIFTVADAMSNSMFMTRVRLDKPRIELVDEDGGETSAVQTLTRDENNEYHGRLYYRIKDNHGDDYSGDAVVNVYADYNQDGYFTPAEKVTEYINQDNMLDVEIAGMGPGVLPWKVEVSDVGNEYRRASVQGYFEMGSDSSDELKVLQITEKKNDVAAGVDLQLIFNKKKDSVLAHYLKGAESILNAEWQIESVTAAQLETKLGENANYLSQWDVVVLTLDDAADNDAVTKAVTRYAEEGRSLLVCGQDPGDQRAGLSAELLGQTEGRTYVNLGGRGASDYQRYDGLKGDMYDGKTLLEAEPVNKGSISNYPYVIDGKFQFGEEGLLKAATYLLDFEDNLASEEYLSYVTPWYTFSSTNVDGSAYGISPRDGRNNYYCYSKGNVFYLAQSAYTYTCDEVSGPDAGAAGSAECRFFVNALVAAYNAGLHNAHVNIVAGFSPDAADITSISVPFDETWTTSSNLTSAETTPDVEGGIVGDTVEVYFKFRDNNFAPEKLVSVGFYYENPDGGELDIGTKLVNATPFASEVWCVTDNKLVKLGEGEELKPGKVYRINAPVVTLKNTTSLTRGDAAQQEIANKADIYIRLETSFTRGGKNYSIISSDAVSLNRTRLFLLE